jgi:hypothetical protein
LRCASRAERPDRPTGARLRRLADLEGTHNTAPASPVEAGWMQRSPTSRSDPLPAEAARRSAGAMSTHTIGGITAL